MSVYPKIFRAISKDPNKDDTELEVLALALEAVSDFADRQERIAKALERIADALEGKIDDPNQMKLDV